MAAAAQRSLQTCLLCNSSRKLGKTLSRSFVLRSKKYQATQETVGAVSLKEANQKWVGVVGLEIHAQIKSASKLFSGAGTQYGESTNSQVSFFDAALPGTLPVLNQKCVQAGVLTALALNCDINRVSTFDRKHYFYADLPAGYQITQHRKPIAVNGELVYIFHCSSTSRVERRCARLVQIQLEQDSGKSLHDFEQGISLIDLNRAGVGLMEIVTAPDFDGGDAAASFVRDLRDLLLTIDTCDGKMAEGSLRVDANISVHKEGEPLGVRIEVKNLNSVKSIRLAIDSEIQRHIGILEEGGAIEKETRSFDVASGETVQMREKEKLLDYRFIPEPNLPPLVIHDQEADSAQPFAVGLKETSSLMKELPEQTRKRLEDVYGLPLLHSLHLVRGNIHAVFERLVHEFQCPVMATSSVLRNFYLSFMEEVACEESQLSKETWAEIIHLFDDKRISGKSVPQLIKEKASNSKANLVDIIESKQMWMVSDLSQIEAIAEGVLSKNPKAVKAYKKGKRNQLKVLTARVLKLMDGKANTDSVTKVVSEMLEREN